ncbi:putative bifunctional diguanylate cyclase/phosphodiesterase, partial [Candidatus Propionivibrio aalborgensis]|uniref:putative bifunctional diguanylate cyclase/phosphodiesterase n=1 Tax=Candidatus Propionivibrio aalborgensis TaxID=1860101 RepID=UPI000A89B39C
DRSLIDHSLDVMSTELEERNQALRRELNERRQAESRIEQSLSLLRATLDATADGIVAVDSGQHVESFNVRFLEMWHIPPEAIGGLHAREITVLMARQLMAPDAFIEMARHFDTHPDAERCEVLDLNDGRILECYSRPRRIGEQIVGRVWSFRDITERRQAETRLAYMANYDSVTGLPNRHLLRERLDRAIKHEARSHRHLAIMFLDLDNFKSINDTLGHDVGDRVLQVVANRLLACLRESDTVARIGGDEFTVLVEDMTTMESIAALAQQIIDSLSLPFPLDGREMFCTVSVGIAIYPDDSESLDGLMKSADSAMYRAKEQGRNTYRFFTEDMHRRAYERLLLENRLRGALKRGEFQLHYQPQIDVASGATVGIEALLRWNDEERGLVPPVEFIGVLEDTGMIVEVGHWVLEEACAFNQSLREIGLPPIRVAVNISPRLKRFPIDTLKIDRSFVRDIMTDSDDAAITVAIIALSRSLRLKVLA